MTKEPLDHVEQVTKDAVRDVAGLYLFFDVNVALMAERRLLWSHLLLLSHALTAWTGVTSPRRRPPIEQQVRLCLRDLVIWTEAIEAICKRRFQGYDVLLPEARKELDDLRTHAQDQLARFCDHLDLLDWRKQESGKRTPKLPKPIEWETLRTELKEDIAARVRLLVDVGRAEACEIVGDARRAAAYRERHL